MKSKPGASALENARNTFASENLVLPPVPERFAAHTKKIDEWCYASRPVDPMTMYLFEDCVAEALTGSAPDYVAFSHAGHGANSYALTYCLLHGPLALIVQTPYGGVYSDKSADITAANALWDRCAQLIAAAEAAGERLALRRGRLYAFESKFRDSCAWGWLDAPLDTRGVDQWREERSTDDGAPPTVAAREWLENASRESN